MKHHHIEDNSTAAPQNFLLEYSAYTYKRSYQYCWNFRTGLYTNVNDVPKYENKELVLPAFEGFPGFNLYNKEWLDS